MKNPMGYEQGARRQSGKNITHFRQFWVKEAPSFRTISDQDAVYRYRSTRQVRVLYHTTRRPTKKNHAICLARA